MRHKWKKIYKYEQFKQRQLEFLTFLATVTFNKNKVETIIQSLLERCVSFLFTSCSYIYCHEKANAPLTKGIEADLTEKVKQAENDINVTQVVDNIKQAQNETILLTADEFFYAESLMETQVEYVVVLPLFSLLNQSHMIAFFFRMIAI